jgi:hypothetical protein
MSSDRRRFLSLITAVAVTGCAGTDGSGGGGSNQETADTTVSTPTMTPIATPQPAEINVVDYETPERAEIGADITISVSVENTGGKAANFSAPLYIKGTNTAWQEVTQVDFGAVEAGETVTAEIGQLSFDFIDQYSIRLGEASVATTLQTVSASLQWGTEYQTPNEYILRIDNPTLQGAYRYETYTGDTEAVEPDSGGQWAFVNVYIRNESGQAAYSPSTNEFAVISGNTQYDPVVIINDPVTKDEAFEGGQLQPGIERNGWIAYDIDGELDLSNIRVTWTETFSGDISVSWQSKE